MGRARLGPLRPVVVAVLVGLTGCTPKWVGCDSAAGDAKFAKHSGCGSGWTYTTTSTGATPTSTADTELSASVSWAPESVSVAVSGGPGAYWFGMAETLDCDDCWTGEDCIYGYQAGGSTLTYCHDGTDTGTTLTYGGEAADLSAGTTVFTDSSYDGTVTYYLESDPDYGGDDSCYVWGADTSYYDGLGCASL